MAELCDWVLADDFSRGFVFGVESEDLMSNVESIYRILDEDDSDSMEVSEENLTRVVDSSAEESGEARNSHLQNGSQATDGCNSRDSYGPATSQTGIEMPSSFDGPVTGGLGPSASCFSDFGGNAVLFPVKCEPGTVPYLDDQRIDSKSSPRRPTMVTPYFNTMSGNVPRSEAKQSSSLISHFFPNSSSNVDGADICDSYEPHGHHTIDAPTEVSPSSVHGHTVQFFPPKGEFVNGFESGFSDCQAYGARQMVLDRHVRLDNETSWGNLLSDDRIGRETSIKCEIIPSISPACGQPYNSFDVYQVVKEREQPYNCLNVFQGAKADVKIKPEPEFMGTNVNVVGETGLQWSGVSNCAVSNQTDVEEYPFMAAQTEIDSRSTEYLDYLVEDEDHEYIQRRRAGFNLSCFSSGTYESFSSDRIPDRDDDSEICKIEPHGEFVNAHQSLVAQRPVLTTDHSTVSQTLNNCGRLKPESNKESRILQAALQDLSQPRSEASPPDGVLAVPLLRHQRIALAWMSEKETSGCPCFGGILADDQGLGKTVSTIALILTERSTPSLPCEEDLKNGGSDQFDHSQVVSNEKKVGEDDLCTVKGMPDAGTLIVCPTSLMRQWADELRKKVTPKANLSVLVYHGCSRTTDPHELAKYDVVITTYSIVNLEVPKQPLLYKDDEEKGGIHDGVESVCLGSDRKDPPKKATKKRKRVDREPVLSLSGPLAKVLWFRVVLDEAQIIKNHKTQGAKACSALHAKRRWCLSGTPIQNSIDDLYSYFRFLNYDPYSNYQEFHDTIKKPICKNPVRGYQKLQAILKTIMLRRTKDTLLDGKPVISLPPKSIELRKVDFTTEERDFYSKLECESRDQFKEYADAGTVQQNYGNILLMLLRLRQACSHPLLVSSSSWESSVEVAKKLPYEKQTFLLNCLATSLAICGICNNAPQDAVVSVCGHVFCKQCICKSLSGDNNHCPQSDCKLGLEISSLFSKATLDSAMPSLHNLEAPCDLTTSDPIGTSDPCIKSSPCGSSKIKAALDILQSLSRPQSPTIEMNDLNQNPQDREKQQLDKSNSFPATPDKSSVDGLVKVVGEKAIVFSQWTKMLDVLEACLNSLSIQYRRFDGKMTVAARDQAIQDFNTIPEVSVMIMSLKAASLGLNMVAACHVLLLDLWWNPTTEDQAIDRAHRIGQTRPVSVVRFTVKDTVEDRILALQEKKRAMVACAFGEDGKGSRQSHLTVEDLNYLFMADM